MRRRRMSDRKIFLLLRRQSPGAISVGCAAAALALGGCHDSTAPQLAWKPSVVVQWDSLALEAVRRTHLGPPMVARALAVAHTAMYDAWAAYDATAAGTRLGATLRRPVGERSP